MTTMTHHSSNQITGLRQLVLFPELLGVISVSLDQCQGKQELIQIEEQVEHQHSLQAALTAGQMTLW